MAHSSVVEAIIDDVVAVAATHGLRCTQPRILRDRSNLLLWLFPTPVVARVPRLSRVIRPNPERHLRAELEIALHLRSHGLPVVQPSPEIAHGPHRITHGYCTFWQHHHLIDIQPHPAELTESIAAMHKALLTFHGDLTDFGPLADLRHGSERLTWTEPERTQLANTIAWFDQSLANVISQPLHGDTHPGNILATTHGTLWTDFEDAWVGPTDWDYAALVEEPVVVDSQPSWTTFELCRQLRSVHSALWAQVLRPGAYAQAAKAVLLRDRIPNT
ncbi:phosphotransferase [Mycolicibacterium setense]|nr:phosphotransferase [Mycolicibacterium setense]MCV7113664.1 phosphotransferase [Mycolicibacterium setense]